MLAAYKIRRQPKAEIPLSAETKSDLSRSAETVCANKSKARLSAENRKSIVSGSTRLWSHQIRPASIAQLACASDVFHPYSPAC